MANLAPLLAFAETARHGSFARAARASGLSASAVAKAVARLEAQLGLRLFHRTTRQVSLTVEGSGLYERCRRIVDELEALQEEARGARATVHGTLRINLPLAYGRDVVVPRLAALALRHPGLALDLSFSDAMVDPVREGFDGVVRIGSLRDSTLLARRIGSQELALVASASWMARHGQPARPADLPPDECLGFRLPSSGRVRPLQFRDPRGRVLEIAHRPRHVLTDGEALLAAAISGLGAVQLPRYMAERALAARQVVELLPAFRPPPLPIWLLMPAGRDLTPRLRALVDALVPPAPPRLRARARATA